MSYNEKLGVMIPSLSDPYTYLKIMLQDQNPQIRAIASHASSILSSGGAALQNETNKNRSMKFLANVTLAQKNHEMAFLQAKINQLQKIGNGTIQQEIIDGLNQCKQNFDYIIFTKTLNKALTTIQQFKSRINKLTNQQLNYDIYNEERMLDDIEKMIQDLSGKTKKYESGIPQTIRQLTLQFLFTYGKDFVQNNNDPLEISAAAVLIQQQLYRYLNDNAINLKQQNQLQKDRINIINTCKNFENILQDFYNNTNVQNIFYNTPLLQEAKNMFGLQITDNQEDSRNRRTRSHNAQNSYKELISSLNTDPSQYFSNNVLNQLKHVTVKWNGKNKISILEEIKLLFQGGGLQMGQLNSATDTLGSLQILLPTINVSENTQDSITLNALKSLRNTLISEKAANKPKETSKIYIQKMQELSNALEGIGKSFVIHDTVKLYKTIQSKNNNFTSYTGRSMNLFNFISSMAEFGISLGASTQWLNFVAYNLSSSALGDFLKNPLQQAFAVAAGLIMFDDFAIIAQQITQGLEFSNVTTIHLYQLQGIYVPASYIMNQTYKRLNSIQDQLQTPNNGISTTISAPGISYIDNNNSTIEDWNSIRNAAHNVKITLHFAASFLDFVGKLLG